MGILLHGDIFTLDIVTTGGHCYNMGILLHWILL